MSIFDAGFIFWGYFLIYALIVVAYYVWLSAANRREQRRRGLAATIPADTHGTVAPPQGEQQA
jgi:hypothetical protein